MEKIDCPNGCQSKSKLVFKGDDNLHNLPGNFQILICNNCKLQRTSPRPVSESIGFYYPDQYGPYMDTIYKENNNNKGLKSYISKILGMKYRTLPNVKIGKMLELGCAAGSYMEFAKSKGWDVEGIEFSPKAASIARLKGFKVHTGTVEDAPRPSKAYDIIVAWMVMEHLHEPHLVLRKLKKWISPNGYFVFLVPDANSISRKVFKDLSFDTQLPTHLFHYEPESLKILLKNNGWEITRIFHQRNANTFLKSIETWSHKKKKNNINKFIKWLNNSHKASIIRSILHLLFGLTKQSGRIEVWARPITKQ